METTRIHLAGIEFDALSLDEFIRIVSESIRSGKNRIIGSQNLHGVYLFHHDSRMRVFYKNAYKIHADGMSLILLAKLFGYPVRREHRLSYLDLVWPLMAESERQGWRVFHLGGEPGVAEKAAGHLRIRHPELLLKTHHGYFNKDEKENSKVVQLIRDFEPNILMVGMGMPLQETWILDNFNRLTANVFLTPGACFDYIAGVAPTPPRWMGRLGLEWLFRLGSNPRSLWKRYLWEPWYVAGLVISQMFQKK